jgi:hypothetical protein
VLFAVGNTLVCDTLDEARHICFGGAERYKGAPACPPLSGPLWSG